MKLFLFSYSVNLRMSFILSFFILSFFHSVSAQGLEFTPNPQQADSLKFVLQHTTNDTEKMVIYKALKIFANEHSKDSFQYFNDKQLEIAQKLHQKIWEGDAYGWSVNSNLAGDYDKSLKSLAAVKLIAEDPESEKNMYIESFKAKTITPHTARIYLLGSMYLHYAQVHHSVGNTEKEFESLKKCKETLESIDDEVMLSVCYLNFSAYYKKQEKLDSALWAAEKSIYYGKKSGFSVFLSRNYGTIAQIYTTKKDFINAKKYLLEDLQESQNSNSPVSIPNNYMRMSYLFKAMNQPDSTILYLRKALAGYIKFMGECPNNCYDDIYQGISEAYSLKGNYDSAYVYLKRSTSIVDNNHKRQVEDLKKYQNFFLEEQKKLKDAEKKNVQLQNYALMGGLGLLSMIGIGLYRNNKQKQKTNTILQEQKNELVQILAKLTSAQNQLIQSEKLASLGELTAGIAHEIQNPLNFVNNFSKMSIELANEVRDEITKIEMAQNDKEYIGDIIKDLNSNQAKIAHHGERASSIVKGMLEHARHDTGTRQLTDINKLCDEYFRLAYHGLRAKHKDFICTMESRFDSSIQPVEIVPQDIGRVILNIINNAFYAMNERKNKGEDPDFVPTVSIVTKRIVDANQNGIEIRITDNGTGIPRGIREKIFNPFFTTKPTGTGNTGLGLSLSYDIITKGHGGTLKVESLESVGTEFIIQLPLG